MAAAPTLDEWIAVIRAFISEQTSPEDFDDDFWRLWNRSSTASSEGGDWVVPEAACKPLGELAPWADSISDQPEHRPPLEKVYAEALACLAELESIRARTG